jgi:acetoacetyl-CoA synthetase
MKQRLEPGKNYNLEHLKSIGSTGSPLPPEAFRWVYEHVNSNILLYSTSGGTDICSSFVSGNPLLPVHAGEIQCRTLGANVQAFDEGGNPVTDEVGEMVITEPMPCMPLCFWGDEDGARYRESYFDMFPGVWRHGDWLKITPRGSCVIYGRSDATLNRMGVRIGTSEIYRAVELETRVKDSLVVSLERKDNTWYMPLFVKLDEGDDVDEALEKKIAENIKERISPRFVPDEIIRVEQIPYTLSGKKMEKPVQRILQGDPAEKAVSRDSMKNPEALDFFISFTEEQHKD